MTAAAEDQEPQRPELSPEEAPPLEPHWRPSLPTGWKTQPWPVGHIERRPGLPAGWKRQHESAQDAS